MKIFHKFLTTKKHFYPNFLPNFLKVLLIQLRLGGGGGGGVGHGWELKNRFI